MCLALFQSTLPTRGETTQHRWVGGYHCISIHSPHTGRDFPRPSGTAPAGHFNPLSPHGERQRIHSGRSEARDFNPLSPHGERHLRLIHSVQQKKFQSTLPTRGETRAQTTTRTCTINFNPLSPHGERPFLQRISTFPAKFQSTLPTRGETMVMLALWAVAEISIHSPRMGRDAVRVRFTALLWDFNPLSPHGERLAVGKIAAEEIQFQSTLPAWGETRWVNHHRRADAFQSTLPAWGETGCGSGWASPSYFNPLSPHGERRQVCGYHPPRKAISIHSPRMGRDDYCDIGATVPYISIHSPRMGRDRNRRQIRQEANISIHSPRMGRDMAAISPSAAASDFNPLSPHGERRRSGRHPGRRNVYFNPLSPHGERRQRGGGVSMAELFQSTLPAWGETHTVYSVLAKRQNFNPLSPHGERPNVSLINYDCG